MPAHLGSWQDVIDLWHSTEVLARDVGCGVEAVRKWSQRGNIPATHWLRLVATPTARKAGLTVERLATLAGRREAVR